MTKPSLLFWKLFLAFWLATSLTFLAAVGVMVLGQIPGRDALNGLERALQRDHDLAGNG